LFKGKPAVILDRGELELVRSHLVVAGLERNAELVARNLYVTHKRCHAGRDGAEIMVVKLLVLR